MDVVVSSHVQQRIRIPFESNHASCGPFEFFDPLSKSRMESRYFSRSVLFRLGSCRVEGISSLTSKEMTIVLVKLESRIAYRLVQSGALGIHRFSGLQYLTLWIQYPTRGERCLIYWPGVRRRGWRT